MLENFNRDFVRQIALPTGFSTLSQKWLVRGSIAFVVFLWVTLTMLVDTRFIKASTGETLQYKDSATTTHSSVLSCRELMALPTPFFSSGEFLTHPTLPHAWVPRADGSREFQHGLCKIHRYTADEAKQCLIGKHVNIIGDSVSRYGANSLAYFIENNRWPQRFGFEVPYCRRFDENGTAVCSTEEDPNLTWERNFLHSRYIPEGLDGWEYFMAKIGGWTDGGIFNGRLECNCAGNELENWMYVTPELKIASNHANADDKFANRVVISVNVEKGWLKADPLHGFNYSGCAVTGTCRYNQTDSKYWKDRVWAGDVDWKQDLLDFLSPNRAIASQLPPVDIVMYNRGIWGILPPERSQQIFPLLYNYSGRDSGQCFFRTTVSAQKRGSEIEYVRSHALASNCSFFDFAGIAENFVELQGRMEIHRGDENWTMITPQEDERYSVFTDDNHYQPWVYEEFNNLWLNVLCNTKALSN
jgi:hypothetical protein